MSLLEFGTQFLDLHCGSQSAVIAPRSAKNQRSSSAKLKGTGKKDIFRIMKVLRVKGVLIC